jgi:hypothetical protein
LETKTKPFPKFIDNPISPVEYAFTSGGEDYFQYVDPFGAPCMRALSAIDHYEVLRKRTTRELDEKEAKELLSQVAKIKAAVNGDKGKISLMDVFEATQQIEYVANSKLTRLNMVFVEDLAYKFASVVFFDQHESPLRCDMEYCNKKIEKWKQDKTLEDFFLQQPIRRLIPFIEELKGSLKNYSLATAAVIAHQSSLLSGRN